jgi:hypothetical protein
MLRLPDAVGQSASSQMALLMSHATEAETIWVWAATKSFIPDTTT